MAQLKCNGRLQRSPRVEEEADPQQHPVSRLTEEAEEDQGAGIAYLDILQEILLHMFFVFVRYLKNTSGSINIHAGMEDKEAGEESPLVKVPGLQPALATARCHVQTSGWL